MNWNKGHIIGRGSTATVSIATTVTGEISAVKSTLLSASSSLQKEQQLLSKLTSPHIIKYIGFDVDYYNHHAPTYNLFMEYATRGTISDVVKKQGGFLDECLIRSYTHQILLGLDYLHSSNLVHCDIKCDNILVCGEDGGVKIGDLGCAKFAEENVISGTPVFMAPEVARGEEQGFAADVWAVGCAVIEMATGSNAWPEIKDPVAGLYRIGYSGEVPLFPVGLSEEAQDFLKNCLQRNDIERWTVKELLKHPFVCFNSSCKKIETLSKMKSTPISVLDQGFWDSLQVTDSPAPTKFQAFFGESPVGRIKQLVEAITPSFLPNWVDDEEDWITVRCNHIFETSKVSQQNLYEDEDEKDDDYSEDSDSTSEDLSLFLDSDTEDNLWGDVDVSNSNNPSEIVSRFLDFKNINDIRCLLNLIGYNFLILKDICSGFAYYFKFMVRLLRYHNKYIIIVFSLYHTLSPLLIYVVSFSFLLFFSSLSFGSG